MVTGRIGSNGFWILGRGRDGGIDDIWRQTLLVENLEYWSRVI